ncbi:Carbohydrate kinase PfkB [Phaffia rhodozyma]|uniref:Carbohydrate kinase PfkB n=1 Tax=Phaffia rhodozyma TaxID=264483 RepID=A0A0F7SRE9_PHARH|nr:Carbohydrate kinase PfkB [Phaffia rhodozyma]
MAALDPCPGRIITLGMFIIDEFEYRDSNGKLIEHTLDEGQIGGGGTYAIVGSRLFLPPQSLGMIVDKGDDFPDRIGRELEAYGTDMWHFRNRTDGERKTTRALNMYTGEARGVGLQSFKYLTPRFRISPSQFVGTPFAENGPPSFVHFVCAPVRAFEIVDEIDSLDGWARGTVNLVWEPMPDDCVPEQLDNVRRICPRLKVISPNHLEALGLVGVEPSGERTDLIAQITSVTLQLASFLSPGGLAVVRSGAEGACFGVVRSDGTVGEARWVPAVFGPSEQDRIKDVTGGGNAFLGGLCAGLKITGNDPYEAVLYGSVAASALEWEGQWGHQAC